MGITGTCLLTLLSLGSTVRAVAEPPEDAVLSCPVSCESSGTDASAWSNFHDTDFLSRCNGSAVFDFNIYNSLAGGDRQVVFRACSIGGRSTSALIEEQAQDLAKDLTPPKESEGSDNIVCPEALIPISTPAKFEGLQWTTSAPDASISDLQASVRSLLQVLPASSSLSAPRIRFVQSGKMVAGIYVGSAMLESTATKLVQRFLDDAEQAAQLPQQLAAQVCGDVALSTFGIFADTQGNLGAVQQAVQGWANATCLESPSVGTKQQVTITIPTCVETLASNSTGSSTNSTGSSKNSTMLNSTPQMSKRATCSYIQAVSGDGCWSLASRCGITQTQLTTYNPSPTFCNVIVGQYVCCSAGTLPDFSPKPNSDGTCASYTVQAGDTCSAMATANSITLSQLDDFNKQTWGWAGCGPSLFVGTKICLSSGAPPMPAQLPGVSCGPQVPGTTRPANWKDIAGQNACPLNACCDGWGYCGTTDEFCVPTPADTGAPGTFGPGTNGCISNCGSGIVNNGRGPDKFMRIGYYESYNYGRPCLHMAPKNIDTSVYTHVHYAFADITSNFQVDVSATKEVFEAFKAVTGVKKILSFGGWSFSTKADTAPIFRNGVTAAQRQTFANNVVKFAIDNNLDGLDFDWEYPGAPDIPGIPPGSPSDGPNYLEFLRLVRQALPSGKSLSIAAPSSFWYLKGFPIREMNPLLDYIVYMTYDLHGQWDYGNKFTSPGCPGGNCLRSQVNMTETLNALAMVTKAGVPSYKIVVGMALYGRSFGMSDPGCTGETCTFTGPASGATPGRCTGTGGYLANYEINQILATPGRNARSFSTKEGDVMIYDNNQWVAYMTPYTYATRAAYFRQLNFGGLVDWAIDLDADYADAGTATNPGGVGGAGGGGSAGSGSNVVYIDPVIWEAQSPKVACIPPCTFVLPPWTLRSATTIIVPPETVTLEETWPMTTVVNGVVTTLRYITATKTTTISIPAITTSIIPVSNVVWSDTAVKTIYATSSIVPPPRTLTEDNRPGQTTTTSGAPFLFWFAPRAYPPGPTPIPTPPVPPPRPPPGGNAGSIIPEVGPPNPVCLRGCGTCTNCGGRDNGGGGGTGVCLNCVCVGPGCTNGGRCVGQGCTSGGGQQPAEPKNNECTSRSTGVNLHTNCRVVTTTSSRTVTSTCVTATATTIGCNIVTTNSATTVTTGSCSIPSASLASLALERTSAMSAAGTFTNGKYYPDAFSVFGGGLPITPPPTITTVIPGPTVTVTVTAPAPPAPTADCVFWDYVFFLTFQIYNMGNWNFDDGSTLQKQIDGCGTITGWEFTPFDFTGYSTALFNIDILLKAGCIERAIRSAGGPQIQCTQIPIIAGPPAAARQLRVAPTATPTATPTASPSQARNITGAVQPALPKQQFDEYENFYGDLIADANVTALMYVPADWSTEDPSTVTVYIGPTPTS
ncbi:Endochitinase B [Sphaceloma murrayae]|uniref:chitinase n=1 Tax=Sphaceloma murrayae TaxID=2082308 RepID=A0A2K1QPN1_9PEZI|nr:Endochitinase B [Sphaceloma murrayae]